MTQWEMEVIKRAKIVRDADDALHAAFKVIEKMATHHSGYEAKAKAHFEACQKLSTAECRLLSYIRGK